MIKTVFTFKEILMESNKSIGNTARNVSYAISAGNLYHIRRGLYAKDEYYNRQEMAVKIYKPAYISFETVLVEEGIIFQDYKTIMVASYKTVNIIADKQKIRYRKLKDELLINAKGLIKNNFYYKASKERAVLDMLYLNKKYHFDNLQNMDWNMMFELVKIYKNKNLEIKLQQIYARSK